MRHSKYVALLVSAALFASTAQAALIVEVQSSSIVAGGTGFADVLIYSNGSDNVTLATYTFSITPVSPTLGSLVFSNPQDETEDETEANYIFAGDSSGMATSFNTGNTFTGLDSTLSSSGVTVTGDKLLLVRLDLQHVLGFGQTIEEAIGEQFLISMNHPSFVTFFTASSGDTVTITGNSPNVVTVVPEPTSLALLGVTGIGFALRRRRRSSKSAVVR